MSPTLGETLRQLRTEKGVSLEQAAQGTHIRIAYLRALELDERHLLPSAVQGKGFLRVYAGYLGAPVEPLLDQWEGRSPPEVELEEQTVELPPPPPPEPEPEPEPLEPLPADEMDLPPTVSQEMFRQIGEELRRQRETISMSLVDVERFTRLKLHYLKALEDGRIEDLPSTVQGRGMLSNYASFLHLDGEALLLRFAEALQARRLERTGVAQPAMSSAGGAAAPLAHRRPAARNRPPVLTWRRVLSPDLIIGGSLFILLFGFVIWGSLRVISMNAEIEEEAPPSIAEMLQDTAAPEGSDPLAVAAAATPSPANGEPPEVALPVSEPAATQTSGPPVSDAAIQVYVVASQRAFLRITADGDVVFNGRTTPGGAYSFAADEQLELLTGNAGGLQVYYQQENMGLLGGVGEVAALLFTAEGVVEPTPAPTITGAPTATATITPQPSPSLPGPTITPFLP